MGYETKMIVVSKHDTPKHQTILIGNKVHILL
jgi:hypothetical protein